MSAIDEVKQRTDIVEVVGQYTSLTKAGRTFRGLCPFHSEKHPSFFVYPEQQSWHCFGACNTGGDVFSFVMKKENIDFGEALRLLAERAGVSLPSRSEPSGRRDEKERLYQINEVASQYFHDLLLNSSAGAKARDYVAHRGLSLEAITKFKLGYSSGSREALKQHLEDIGHQQNEILAAGLIVEGEAGETHDRFRSRLMFPIYDIRGRTAGFGARALDESLPKYLNSPQTAIFDKSSSLYGINLAAQAIRTQDVAVIVEGYTDVITAHQHGYANVVANMGTAITEKQIMAIKRLTNNIVLALDADNAGEEAMLRCVGYENIIDAEIKVTMLPKGKDPDEVIREDHRMWQKLLKEALPVVDYTFDITATTLDLTSAKGKSLAVDRLLPVIAEIKNPVRQAHYLQKLAQLVKVTERYLEAALSTIRPSPRRSWEEGPRLQDTRLTPRLPFSSPIEEYCLALLLKYPGLKHHSQPPLAEYFQNSENQAIFTAWQQTNDPSALRDRLDPAIWEHLDYLVKYLDNKELSTNQVEVRYADCVLRLREEFLRSLETKRGQALALEAEIGGVAAELAKLREQGTEVSIQLGEVFSQKRDRNRGAKK